MLIKIKTSADVPYSEVTPEHDLPLAPRVHADGVGRRRWRGRRRAGPRRPAPRRLRRQLPALPAAKKTAYVTDPAVDPLNTFEQIIELQQLLRVRHAEDRPGAQRRAR